MKSSRKGGLSGGWRRCSPYEREIEGRAPCREPEDHQRAQPEPQGRGVGTGARVWTEPGGPDRAAEESGQHAKGWKGKREMGLIGTHREGKEAGEEQRGKSGGQMHPKWGQGRQAAARQRQRRGE